MRPGIEHEARSIKHVPPAKARVAPRLCNQGNSNSISASSTIFDSLARLDAWHQLPSLFLLPFQALPSFLFICIAMAHGSVTRSIQYLSSFGGARESDHQIRSNISGSKSSTSLLHLLGCLSSERKREAWLICHLLSSVRLMRK